MVFWIKQLDKSESRSPMLPTGAGQDGNYSKIENVMNLVLGL